jgi:uncharacterized protein YggE
MRSSIRVVLCAAALAAIPGIAAAKGPLVEPDEGPDPRGLTLTGSGAAYVRAPARPGEASVRRAVEAAKPAAMRRALADAQARAQRVASAAGLSLGEPQVITERDPAWEYSYAPQRFCSLRRPEQCRVPLLRTVSVTVTFATAQTSATATGGRVLVVDGSASIRVRPRNRRSSASIRAALATARMAAGPAALKDAMTDASRLSRITGVTGAGLFAIAEVRRPFEDPGIGSFGPGRFCGNVRRAIARRDPRTGRRRIVRRVTTRRCFYPTSATVALRVTVVGG